MTLFLVRHGRAAVLEQEDPALDALGRRQAEITAAALVRVGAKRLVVSPLLRARQTAEPIAKALGLEPEVCAEVAEVFHASMSMDERRALVGPLLGGRWSQQADDLRLWRTGVIDTLVALGQSQPRVIVVSHFVAINVAVGEATGDDRVSPCPLANASITTVDVDSRRLVLRRAGDVAHLPADALSVHAPLPGPRPR